MKTLESWKISQLKIGRKSLKTLLNGIFRSVISLLKQPIENIGKLNFDFSENKAQSNFGLNENINQLNFELVKTDIRSETCVEFSYWLIGLIRI